MFKGVTPQNFLLTGILFIVVMYVIKWFIDQSTQSCSKKENMQYLDVYEQQDFYKNNPQIYPVPYTYTSGKYAFERNGIDIDIAEKIALSNLNCGCSSGREDTNFLL